MNIKRHSLRNRGCLFIQSSLFYFLVEIIPRPSRRCGYHAYYKVMHAHWLIKYRFEDWGVSEDGAWEKEY